MCVCECEYIVRAKQVILINFTIQMLRGIHFEWIFHSENGKCCGYIPEKLVYLCVLKLIGICSEFSSK